MDKSCNILLYSAFTRMLPSIKYITKFLKTKNINPQQAKVLFVPFADEQNKYYIALCKQALLLCGIQKSNIGTLTSHTHKTAKADIIFVSGGNVCALKEKLIKIDWLNELKNRIFSGTLYIGDSAGAVILGKTIAHTLDYEPYDTTSLDNLDGLNIIDKGVVVHYSLYKYSGKQGLVKEQECYDAHIKQTLFLGKNNFLTIGNNQVIIIKNGKLKNKFFRWRTIQKTTDAESQKYGKR